MKRLINFAFDLFGFDLYWADQLFGFWIAQFTSHFESKRCLLCVYYSMGEWYIDVLWINLYPFEPRFIDWIEEWYEERRERKIEKEMNQND